MTRDALAGCGNFVTSDCPEAMRFRNLSNKRCNTCKWLHLELFLNQQLSRKHLEIGLDMHSLRSVRRCWPHANFETQCLLGVTAVIALRLWVELCTYAYTQKYSSCFACNAVDRVATESVILCTSTHTWKLVLRLCWLKVCRFPFLVFCCQSTEPRCSAPCCKCLPLHQYNGKSRKAQSPTWPTLVGATRFMGWLINRNSGPFAVSTDWRGRSMDEDMSASPWFARPSFCNCVSWGGGAATSVGLTSEPCGGAFWTC